MEFNDVLEKLNEKTDNVYGFVLGKATLHDNNCLLEIRYKDGTILGPDKRKELQIFTLENLPAGFMYDIKFVKNYKTFEVVKVSVNDIVKENFPALIYEVVSFDDAKGELTINVDEDVFLYAQNKNVKEIIEEKLKEIYLSNFIVNIYPKSIKLDVDDPQDFPEFSAPTVVHKLEVSEISALCGDKVTGSAGYISDATGPMQGVTFCGKITFLNSREYQKKGAKDATPENAKPASADIADGSESSQTGAAEKQSELASDEKAYVKKLFKFNIKDFSGELSCIYFPSKTNLPNAEKLAVGSEVIVCVLPKVFEEVIEYKSEPERYTFVRPEPYVSETQVDLFSALELQQEATAPYLEAHDVVVFDFETTGLSATDCKIVEIGAVKVHNGKITETFETFVDPEEHIDDDSTKVHGITDEMVAGSPNYARALQDFYKFTRNATLVAYNISFDFSFLDLYGKKAGYNFDNPQIDALRLASINVKGVKNYKLKTIAEKLGVVLDNAHRAIYDTIATAEVFIKLAKFIKVDGSLM